MGADCLSSRASSLGGGDAAWPGVTPPTTTGDIDTMTNAVVQLPALASPVEVSAELEGWKLLLPVTGGGEAGAAKDVWGLALLLLAVPVAGCSGAENEGLKVVVVLLLLLLLPTAFVTGGAAAKEEL